jgi:hypothetical protein
MATATTDVKQKIDAVVAMAHLPAHRAAAAAAAAAAPPISPDDKIGAIGSRSGIATYSFAADPAAPPPRLRADGAAAAPRNDEDGSTAFGWDAVKAASLLRGPQDPCLPGRSLLDGLILAMWEGAAAKGLLRYDVTACPTKVLPGDFGFVAQLNEGRATKKRPTEFKLDEVGWAAVLWDCV